MLPLVDVSETNVDAKLATGLTEELRSAIGHIPGVSVASSTETSALRENDATAQEIGRKLGVATLLEGTLERDGTRIRLSARLVDTKDGLSRWSDVFEREATTRFDVQREVTTALVGAVAELLAPSDTASGAPRPRKG